MDFEGQDLNQPKDDLFDLDMPREQPKKKKKTGLLVGIIAAVVAVAVLIGLLFALGVFKKEEKAATPEELHAVMVAQHRDTLYAAAEQLQSNMNTFSTLIGEQRPTGAHADLHLLLGETLLSRLETSVAQAGLEMDLSWLQDIAVGFDMSATDTETQYFLSLGLGDKKIGTLDLILDAKTLSLYMGVPELSSYYTMTELVDSTEIDMEGYMSIFQGQQAVVLEFYENLAAIEGMDVSLKAYIDLLLGALKNPQIAEETATLEGVSQTFTTVTYRLTEADVLALAEAILQQAKNDEALKQLIVNVGSYANEMMKNSTPNYEEVDLYQEFLDALEEGLTELPSTETDDANYLELTCYLDTSLQLQGHKLTIYSAEETVPATLRWINVADGTRELVEFVIGDETGSVFSVTGEQSAKDGIYNATFKLSFPEKKTLTLALTDIREENGSITGSIQLTPSITLMQELLGDAYASMRLLLGGKLGLRLDLEEMGYGIHLTADGESVIGLTAALAYTEGKGIVFPAEDKLLTGEDAIDQWLATLDSDVLTKKLEEAGVPIKELLETAVVLPEDAV